MTDVLDDATSAALPQNDSNRGRDAAGPAEIPGAGWYDIAKRVQSAIVRDNLALVAAGLSMYALLSFLPLTAAAVSIYAMFGNPTDLGWSTRRIGALVPTGVWHLLAQQLRDATGRNGKALTGTAVISVFLSLWSARAAMASLMRAANIAYSEQEKRTFRLQLSASSGDLKKWASTSVELQQRFIIGDAAHSDPEVDVLRSLPSSLAPST
jgi:Virulence factor BrkB